MCCFFFGACAIWQIPELNITIPLYQAKNRIEAQKQVDNENSASIYRFRVGKVIADHAQSQADKGRIWDIS